MEVPFLAPREPGLPNMLSDPRIFWELDDARRTPAWNDAAKNHCAEQISDLNTTGVVFTSYESARVHEPMGSYRIIGWRVEASSAAG